jgi:CDP-diacylglycerol--serine O-phosphatidyltransferase
MGMQLDETEMDIRRLLPAGATLANVAAGFAACACVVADRPDLAALLVLGAVLLDSLDGALARSLDATSRMGAQLDSLADVVSFGLAPAVLAGSLLPGEGRVVGWAIIAIYPLCAAWRLARFNVCQDELADSHDDFAGLPSTGAGGAAATAALVYLRLAESNLPLGGVFLPCVMAALGVLMVSHIAYKHAGSMIARLNPLLAAFMAVVFVVGTVFWEYQFLFAGVMWSYVLYAPVATATQKLRAARQA